MHQGYLVDANRLNSPFMILGESKRLRRGAWDSFGMEEGHAFRRLSGMAYRGTCKVDTGAGER